MMIMSTKQLFILIGVMFFAVLAMLMVSCGKPKRSHHDFEGQVKKEVVKGPRFFFELDACNGQRVTFYAVDSTATALDLKVDPGMWFTICCPEKRSNGTYCIKSLNKIQEILPHTHHAGPGIPVTDYRPLEKESIEGREF